MKTEKDGIIEDHETTIDSSKRKIVSLEGEKKKNEADIGEKVREIAALTTTVGKYELET